MKLYHLFILIICITLISCNNRRADQVEQNQPRLDEHESMHTDYFGQERRPRTVEPQGDQYLSERGGRMSAERVRSTEQRLRELMANHADMMQEHRKLMDEHRAFLQLDRSEVGDEEWHERFRQVKAQQDQMERDFQRMKREYEIMREEQMEMDRDRRVRY